MNIFAKRSRALRHLRLVLGLRQAELGWLLGLGGRTVVRLETEDKPTGLDPAVDRLLWLVGETRLEDAEDMLRALLLTGAPGGERLEALGDAISRVRGLEAQRGLRLADVRITRWAYWATGERADVEETRRLAVEEGVVCRPLEPQPSFLTFLAPGARVLLCHSDTPIVWLELLETEEEVPEAVQPIFRYIRATDPLGRRLMKSKYRLMDGQLATGRASERFSCLAVAPLAAKLETPALRGRGVRDTLTPFVAAGG